jgi:ribosomal protein L29
MAKKKTETSLVGELDAAKLEMMRIRFRRVLGESVSAHVIKNARKNIVKCVKSLNNNGEKDV